MQLETALGLNKLTHKRYAFAKLDTGTYQNDADLYSNCKKFEIRGVYVFASVTEVYHLIADLYKGRLVQYVKIKVAVALIGAATYISSTVVAVITNATKVVKDCKAVYTTIGYFIEAIKDTSNLGYLLINLALFGQPIPIGEERRFSKWDNVTDQVIFYS